MLHNQPYFYRALRKHLVIGQIRFGSFANLSKNHLFPSPATPLLSPRRPKQKLKGLFFFTFRFFVKNIHIPRKTPHPTPKNEIRFGFLVKNHSPTPIHFFHIWVLCQFVKKITYPPLPPPILPPLSPSLSKTFHLTLLPHPHSKKHLCFRFGFFVNFFKKFTLFCLVSLTLAYRKTSYRSLKRTAGSTNCLWTTILVLYFPLVTI